jgi:hypothetical protein
LVRYQPEDIPHLEKAPQIMIAEVIQRFLVRSKDFVNGWSPSCGRRKILSESGWLGRFSESQTTPIFFLTFIRVVTYK